MYRGLEITPPFFEVGPKAYMYGEELLRLAKFADEQSQKHGVQVIVTPQYVDIPILARETEHLLIFAQHMDALGVGKGVGSVLPEAVKAAGAVGVLLNHSEKPLPMETVVQTIERADAVGLATMVCAGRLEEAAVVARMEPNVVLVESPALIGTGRRGTEDQLAIAKANRIVWGIDPEIRVLHGAGISCGQDVYNVVASGAQGTGSSSAIMLADDPCEMLEDMLRCVRLAWDRTH